MSNFIFEHGATLRLTVFLIVLLLMAAWELAAPRRRREIPRLIRWSNNLLLVAIDSMVVRFLFPILATGLAVVAKDQHWGLLNLVALPSWVAILVSMIALDLVIFLQHLVFHAVPVLWRLHRVHHADIEFDVTTAVRFHPFEIVLSMAVKMAAVGLLGAPPVAVLLFEVLLNATAMFNHANVHLPKPVDHALRSVLVTPDMHRVHHSVRPDETNSNFGFNLSWWDRLFGTYCAQPAAGHEQMTIGLEAFRSGRDLWLDRLLIQPLLEPEPPHPRTSDEAAQ
ncbi:MAG: sterol desaturase family protein [Rhodobacteraceae bacterium]|nr:sterol desaturase family protein [Paracoccaceae bacterium]